MKHEYGLIHHEKKQVQCNWETVA